LCPANGTLTSHSSPHLNYPCGWTVRLILKVESLSSGPDDAALDLPRAELGVAVGHGSKGSLGGGVFAATEINVIDNGVAGRFAVNAEDGLGGAGLEDGRLDEELRAHPGVDAGAFYVVIVVAALHGVRTDREEK